MAWFTGNFKLGNSNRSSSLSPVYFPFIQFKGLFWVHPFYESWTPSFLVVKYAQRENHMSVRIYIYIYTCTCTIHMYNQVWDTHLHIEISNDSNYPEIFSATDFLTPIQAWIKWYKLPNISPNNRNLQILGDGDFRASERTLLNFEANQYPSVWFVHVLSCISSTIFFTDLNLFVRFTSMF